MHFSSFPVEQQDYESRTAKVKNCRTISEYSVTVDREVKNDLSYARYLIEENVRNGVFFDLTIGQETFIDKSTILQNESFLTPLCRWAISQPGNSIKEVFGGADFASWRSTMKRIAMTVLNNPFNKFPSGKDAWTIVAQEFGGVILISEQPGEFEGDRLDFYSNFKFKQYMTADEPDGRPDTRAPVDNRPTFEMMVRSDLVDGESKLQLCCGTEVDALRRDSEPIEFKTIWEEMENGFFRDAVTVIQSELVGVKRIVTGLKKGDRRYDMVYVQKVVEKQVSEIKGHNNISEAVGQGYSFLFDVLARVKMFLIDHSACEVSFDPFQQVIIIKGISQQQAKIIGHGATEDFLARFDLMQESKTTSSPIESTRKKVEELNLSKAFRRL